MALTTISSGSRAGSSAARRTTMFVSIRPRAVSPVTVERVLLDGGVEVGAQPVGVDDRGGGEGGHHLFAGNVSAPPKRDEAADRGAIACDRVGLASLDPAHDGTGVVPELALSDLVAHQ